MSEAWAIALLGLFLAGIFGYAFRIDQVHTARNEKLDDKVDRLMIDLAKLQTEFAGMLMRNSVISAGLAHSPLDHLGLDKPIEEYNDLYLKHHGNMPAKDWLRFRDIFAKAVKDPHLTAVEHALIMNIVQACEHKMEGFGFLSEYPRP